MALDKSLEIFSVAYNYRSSFHFYSSIF